jgi:A/G-specific adenine glycosylase
MLQQTQVAVVLRYWAPFLERFPTLPALAEATPDAVLAAWRGLGYYARARNLHRAARAVVAQHQGVLPDSASALAQLPGFGRYTVGAVASIAFGRKEPVVDGNVARVLSRLFAVEGRPGEASREATLWAIAHRLVDARRPGDWNQALMELGATLCRVAQPLCLLCPLRAHCQAVKLGKVEQLPPPKLPTPRRPLRLAVAVVHRRGRLLLGRRPAHGLFGGLWEAPAVELPMDAGPADVQRALAALLGARTRVGASLGEVRRTLTHRELTLSLFSVRVEGRPSPGPYLELRFVSDTEARGLGVSTAMQTALAHAGKEAATAASRRAPARRKKRARPTQ